MKKILIISGIHGDEPSGPHIVIEFLRKIDQYPGLEFEILPLLNPVGFAQGTRENGEGKDLNRWFFDKPHKDEPLECSLIRKFFCEKTYDLVVSFHEDPEVEGFYLYDADNGKDSSVIQAIFMAAKFWGITLWSGIDNSDDPVCNKVVEDGYCGVQLNDPAPMLEEYLIRNGNAKRGITLEVPGKLPLKKKIHFGKIVLKTILEQEK